MDTNEEMTINEAFVELEISLDNVELTKIDNEYLKKQYHKMALKWHPDKHSRNINQNKNNDSINANKKFQRINEAYTFLQNEFKILNGEQFVSSSSSKKTKNNFDSNNYINILNNFISSLSRHETNEDIFKEIINKIVLECNNITESYLTQIFTDLDKHRSIELYQFLYKYKHILHLSNSLLELVSSTIRDKFKNDEVIILKPKLADVLNNSIYKLNINDKLYLVPLWHNELYFDITPDSNSKDCNSNTELIVICQPEVPSNICIDDNNNIIYEKNINIDDELRNIIKSNFIHIEIGDKWFSIPSSQLYLKEEQIFKFKRQGITMVYEKDIYNVSNRSDIIVKIKLI